MNFIIIGGGSIGTRHASNLQKLGCSTTIVDLDEIENIDYILKTKFDGGFVCTPNVHHIEHCIKLAENNIPIFCEKPFYSDPTNLHKLLELVNEKKITTMVGCNLRFLPSVQSINPSTKYISVYFGYNLKKWRPGTNHLLSYSANKNQGGGILLDAIHELDYLYYKFGDIQNISYNKLKASNVTVDAEDIVTGRITFTNGTVADFHLNYLADEYYRYYDVLNGDVLQRVNVDVNDEMYIEEVKYFIECLKNQKQCKNNFNEAYNLLRHLI